jgi:hypothetical protein
MTNKKGAAFTVGKDGKLAGYSVSVPARESVILDLVQRSRTTAP